MSEKENPKQATLVVWDPWIRLFHWMLVASVVLAFLSSEEESALSVWHIPAGWVAALLLAFRLTWGFVGGQHARFSAFVRPTALGRHLGQLLTGKAEPSVGHNPLGALAVLALLIGVGATIFTGATGGEDGHEWVAYSLLALVALHVVAVVVMSVLTRDNLARAMVTGRKSAELFPGVGDARPATRLAFVVAALVVAATAVGVTRLDPKGFAPVVRGEAGEASDAGEGVESGED